MYMKITRVAKSIRILTQSKIKKKNQRGASVKIRDFKQAIDEQKGILTSISNAVISFHLPDEWILFKLSCFCEKNLIQTRNLARHQGLWIFLFSISVASTHLTFKYPSRVGFTFLFLHFLLHHPLFLPLYTFHRSFVSFCLVITLKKSLNMVVLWF